MHRSTANAEQLQLLHVRLPTECACMYGVPQTPNISQIQYLLLVLLILQTVV